MSAIVVCGEALVDVVTGTRSSVPGRLPAMSPALGGGPFNVAICLARLGSAVSFFSRVSTDQFGEEILRALAASGVDVSLCLRGDEPTDLAMATIGDDGSARYSFYLDGTASRLVADPGAFPYSVAAMCFGTLSLVLEPGASVYTEMMRRAHQSGVLVMIDPNIRSAVIADADSYRARFATWTQHADIVKVSDEDAEWLAAGAAGSTPRQWCAAGVVAVVTSAGADGLRVLTADGRQIGVRAPAVVVADTIGAGDTVVGALLNWCDRHNVLNRERLAQLTDEQWHAALTFAAEAAAVTVSRPGADPPWAPLQVTD